MPKPTLTVTDKDPIVYGKITDVENTILVPVASKDLTANSGFAKSMFNKSMSIAKANGIGCCRE